jgi:tyrosyl-tRNA synthetase
MRRFQLAGHKPYALLGTATSLIGDPTGKTELRQMLTPETIAHNCERFREQMERILDFNGSPPAEIVRNGDWFADIKYLEFLGQIGRHFSVNKMLTAECFRSRFEGKGLSFLEFNYMLLQSYDFLHLFRALTLVLLTTGDGAKMGKSAGNAIWLDGAKTPPHEFFQHWRNVDDSIVIQKTAYLSAHGGNQRHGGMAGRRAKPGQGNTGL